MWVNEAQRGDAVSNTSTGSLISTSGGLGVGVGLRDDASARHQKRKRGGVHLIRREWLRYVQQPGSPESWKLYCRNGSCGAAEERHSAGILNRLF